MRTAPEPGGRFQKLGGYIEICRGIQAEQKRKWKLPFRVEGYDPNCRKSNGEETGKVNETGLAFPESSCLFIPVPKDDSRLHRCRGGSIGIIARVMWELRAGHLESTAGTTSSNHCCIAASPYLEAHGT